MNFLATEEKNGKEKRVSRKTAPPASSAARRGRRAQEVRKEKRNMTLKRRRTVDSLDSAAPRHSHAAVVEAITKLKMLGTASCLEGLGVLRDVLCDEDAPIQVAIDGGCVSSLINLMRDPNIPVQADAVWCLTNIASGSHEQTKCVLEAVPELLSFIGGDDASLREQACWTLGNIAGDSDELRSILVKNGAVWPIVKLLSQEVGGDQWKSKYEERERAHLGQYSGGSELERRQAQADLEAADLSLLRAQTAAWALSNLARGSTPASVFLETAVVPLLVSLITHPHAGLAGEVWWLFTFLTAKQDAAVQELISNNIVGCIETAMEGIDPRSTSCIPLIRCLGNLSSGPELWIDDLVRSRGVLTALGQCVDLDSSHHAVLKESVWVLTNLLGGNERQRVSVLNAGSLQQILPALYCDYFDVQREALFALRHACQTTEVVLRLLDGGADMMGLLEQLVEFLGVPDEEALVGALEVLQALVFASPATKATVLHEAAKVGMLEALEKLEYGPGSQRLKEPVDLLKEELETALEEPQHDLTFGEMDPRFSEPQQSTGNGRERGTRGVSNKPAWMTKT